MPAAVFELPDDSELVRTTAVFDSDTVPAGLLRAHRVAVGMWGRLVVHAGIVNFVFDDDGDHPVTVAGGTLVIPPARPHHLELSEDASFAVEFWSHRNLPVVDPDTGPPT